MPDVYSLAIWKSSIVKVLTDEQTRLLESRFNFEVARAPRGLLGLETYPKTTCGVRPRTACAYVPGQPVLLVVQLCQPQHSLFAALPNRF